MPKLLFLFIILWNFPVLAQQESSKVSPEDKAFNDFVMHTPIPIVTGKIINCSPEFLEGRTINCQYILPYSPGIYDESIPVNKDGSFQIKSKYPIPYQQMIISMHDYFFCQLFVTKDLHFEIDMHQLSKDISSFEGQGLRFSGTDGELCQYIHQCTWYSKKDKVNLKILTTRAKRNEQVAYQDFLKICIENWKAHKRIDSAYIATHPSPYSWLINNCTQAYYLNELLQSPYYRMKTNDWLGTLHSSPIQECIDYKGYCVSSDCILFYSSLTFYLFNQFTYQHAPEFYKELLLLKALPDHQRQLLQQGIQLGERYNQGDKKVYTAYYKIYKELQTTLTEPLEKVYTPRFLSYLDSIFPPAKADLLKMNLLLGDPEDKQNLIQLLQPSLKTPWCLKILKDELIQVQKEIAQQQQDLKIIQSGTTPLPPCQNVGKTDFGAHLYKVEKYKAKDFLTALQKNFPGKALIIDFWSTWCGWCPSALQTSHEYKQALKDSPVEFIYICTSSSTTETKWQTRVAQLKIPGIHIFLDTHICQKILEQYALKEVYPTIIFINKEGKYVPEALSKNYLLDGAEKVKTRLQAYF